MADQNYNSQDDDQDDEDQNSSSNSNIPFVDPQSDPSSAPYSTQDGGTGLGLSPAILAALIQNQSPQPSNQILPAQSGGLMSILNGGQTPSTPDSQLSNNAMVDYINKMTGGAGNNTGMPSSSPMLNRSLNNDSNTPPQQPIPVDKSSDVDKNASNRAAQLQELMKQYQAAQGASNLNKLGAGLNMAEQQSLAAAGRKPADYASSQALMANANAPIEGLQNQLKFQNLVSGIQQNQEISDSNSPTSKLVQKMASKYTGIDADKLKDVSAENLMKILPVAAKTEIAQQLNQFRSAQFQNKQETAQQKTAGQAADTYTKEIKPYQDQAAQINKAAQLYDQVAANGNRSSIDDMVALKGVLGNVTKTGGTGRIESLIGKGSQFNSVYGNLENAFDNYTKGDKKILADPQFAAIGQQLHQMQGIANQDLMQHQQAAQAKAQFKSQKLNQDVINKITPNNSQSSDMVKVKSPQGDIHLIPKDDVDDAVKAGGQVVQ